MNEDFIHEFYIPDYICQGLIDYHQQNKEYKREGTTLSSSGESLIDKNIKDSVDVIFFNGSGNPIICAYFDELSKALTDYVKKYGIGNYKTFTQNLIQYYPPGGGYKRFHYERCSKDVVDRGLVYMTYLNDVNDEGGTEFKYQKTTFKARKGLSLIWPSDFTHTHRGIVSPTQEKYIATGWFINT
jgi:hypothetical protein|tara:strand:+ start:156 stop:710 length:555 start_codon:yes stop_codon:yes gene_type:complete